MIFLVVIITALYCIIIGVFIIGFDRVKEFKSNHSNQENSFSILIPFKDEELVLPDLLKSLQQLDYQTDKFEIIFIDDDSKDDSVEIIERYFDKLNITYRILENIHKTNSPKKDAINTAIQQAKFDWVITTDADCIVSKKWLNSFDGFIQKNEPKMIVAPVTYTTKNTFLEQFQLLDFLSLQGSTIGGFGIKKPFLCNGANLCYYKETFNNVNGFEDNTEIASGDDVFLLEKFVEKYPEKVFYLKSEEAVVTTISQPTIKQLINQRVRWASKSIAYKNSFSKFIGFIILSMNALLIVLFLLTIFKYFKWQYLLLIFTLKFVIDLLLLYKTAQFFKQTQFLPNYILSSLMYPVFIMFVVIASLTTGYNWKGRQFKK